MAMKDEAEWRPACGSWTCPCARAAGEPCQRYEPVDVRPGTMPRCACCGWPEVSHVPEPERARLRHPWHIEHALRAAINDPGVQVRRLHDNLRGEPRFVVVATPGRAVALARAVPEHLDRYVSIELADDDAAHR